MTKSAEQKIENPTTATALQLLDAIDALLPRSVSDLSVMKRYDADKISANFLSAREKFAQLRELLMSE